MTKWYPWPVFPLGLVAFCFVVGSCANWCGDQGPQPPSARFEFSAAYMHEPHHFSVLAVDGGGAARIVDFRGEDVALRIDTDRPFAVIEYVPADPSCRGHSVWCERRYSKQITLHLARPLDGAGWDHGKFGAGTTIRIP